MRLSYRVPLVFNKESVRPHNKRVTQRDIGAKASVINTTKNANILFFISIPPSLYFNLVLNSRSTSHVKTTAVQIS